MYLKTLQLRGFKSFASATTLEFEPGITCVVGPNGSGKSNVVDALSWVMGEQGVKTLRGGKMEDVIFAGTTTRSALGRAEVSLTIDNSDGALDIDYTEVTLTRTLFRNGGSEYAINGAQCRLLDIQDLLSDTGLGREMHVIVGQGQLDAVLRATPSERRGFIEEAAGVLKHRKRKEKALRKLDGMQGNLLRLQDLLAEIRRQLGPLARQAKAAQRAHTLAVAVRDSGLRLLGDDLFTATQELQSYMDSTAERKRLLRTSEAELESLQSTIAQKEHAAAVANPHATAAQEVLLELQGQREQLRNLNTLATERLRHLGTATHDDGIDLTQLRGQLQRVEQAAHEAKQMVDQAREQAAKSAATKAAGEQKLRLAQQNLARHDAEISRHRELVATLSSKVSAQRSTVAALAEETQRLRGEHSAAAARLAEAQKAAPDQSSQPDEQTTGERADREELDRATTQLAAARGKLGTTEKAIATANSQLAGATARAGALELSLEHGHGDQAVLTELDGVVGQILGMFFAPRHLEQALAAALGAIGSAAVTQDRQTALAVVQSTTALELGTATVVHPAAHTQEFDRAEVEVILEELQDPQAGILLDLVTIEGAQDWLKETLSQQLHHVVVVNSLETATAIVKKLPYVTAVTLQGYVVTDGQVKLWAPKDSGPLRLRTELASAQQDIATYTQELSDLSAQEEHHQIVCKELLEELNQARHRFEQVLAQNQKAAQERSRALGLLHTARQEVERAAANITAAQARLVSGELELELAAEQLGTVSDSVVVGPENREALQAAVELAEEELNQLRDQETEVRVTLRGLQEQFAAQTQRAGATARNLKNQELAVVKAREANERRERMAQRAQVVQQESQDALAHIERSIATATLALEQINSQRQERDHELGQLRGRSEQLHQLVRTHVEVVHKDELHNSALRQQVELLESKAIENYGMTPGDVVNKFGPHVPIEVPGAQTEGEGIEEIQLIAYVRSEQEEIFAQSQRKLTALGKINPLALEEFTALEERHQFLSEQLEDLTSSRADLLNLVTDIDNRVEQAFAQAYADTAAQFEKVFDRLFPGGQGKLILEDPEDPLTTGIEIEARPAGKQVKRLSLLSGGERSLTAIAFLVAIFLARPSPFYVMDEVEAALDDVNLGRLLAVFEELRKSSQLIIISHQKRTMQIADALYGVTMAGDGISTVISQRLGSQSA